MSFGNFLSAIGYGIMGFLYGGPVGAYIGFVVGFGISLAMDALAPDMPSPGQPNLSELSLPTADEGLNIPDILGTTKLSGNIFQYFGSNTVEVTEQMETGGKGGRGDTQTVVTGYKYYLSWAMGICLGPVDTLFSIYFGDILVYSGDLARPDNGLSIIDLTSATDPPTYDTRTGTRTTYTRTLDIALASRGYIAGGYQYVLWSDDDATVGFVDKLLQDSYTDYTVTAYMYRTFPQDGGVRTSPGKHVFSWTFDPVTKKNYIVVADPFDDLWLGWPPDYDQDKVQFTIMFEVDYEETYEIPSAAGPSSGTMYFYYGTDNQPVNAKMQVNIANTPPYRGLCYAFFDNVCIGNYNRMPAIKFVIGKFPEHSFNNQHRIGDFDYNPAHAIWYVKSDSRMAGLPEEYLDSISFNAAANILSTEGRGIGILFDRQQTAMAYITTILEHANAILRYSSSGDLKDEPK